MEKIEKTGQIRHFFTYFRSFLAYLRLNSGSKKAILDLFRFALFGATTVSSFQVPYFSVKSVLKPTIWFQIEPKFRKVTLDANHSLD